MSLAMRRMRRTKPMRWLSGAGDAPSSNIAGGGFGLWRGGPISYARAWGDANLDNQVNLHMLGAYSSWQDGTVDIATGGLLSGESWTAAANGDYDARWTQQAQKIVERWGVLRSIHISAFHECNGTWYPWSINNATTFKAGFARWSSIVRSELAGYNYKIVLNLNSDNNCNIPIASYLPPTSQFDILGVDMYSMFPDILNQTDWDNWYNSTNNNCPRGLGAWIDYAVSLDKPLTFPEWGVNSQALSDNPFWIGKMFDEFRKMAPSNPYEPLAGQIAGEAYFNGATTTRLYPTNQSQVPLTAARYQELF